MIINNLLEIIEPTTTQKQWKGEFDSNPNRHIKNSKTSHIDSGNFSTVKNIPNDPHLVQKTSSNPYIIKQDGYWTFINEIIQNQLWENPYFPRVYEIKEIKDQKGNSMFRGKIEKLFPLNQINYKEIEYIYHKSLGVNIEKTIQKEEAQEFNNVLIKEFAKFIEFYTQHNKQTKESFAFDYTTHYENFDSLLQQAIQQLKEIRKKYTLTIDIHDDNIMIRKGPYGIQPVITDPFIK